MIQKGNIAVTVLGFLAIFLIFVYLFISGGAIHLETSLTPLFPASPPMMKLRTIEKQLNLGSPLERSELDGGCKMRGIKNVYSCERGIQSYYQGITFIDQVKDKALNDGWNLTKEEDKPDDGKFIRFEKVIDGQKYCMNTLTHYKDWEFYESLERQKDTTSVDFQTEEDDLCN